MDWTWLHIMLAFWGAVGWFLFLWVALWRQDPAWGYVVLLHPEGEKTKLRTVWCSKQTAEHIAGAADVVRS